MKNITRLDRPDEFLVGYNVRVGWRNKMHRKFFSDKRHGGKRGALMAAKAWRDEKEELVNKPRTERKIYFKKSAGIRLTNKNGGPSYEVTWCQTPGKVSRTSVSIKKHGQRKALEKAREIRRKKYEGML